MSAPNDPNTPPPISPSDSTPTPVSGPDTGAAVASSSTTVAGGLTPTMAASLACFFSLIGGIVFLVLEKRNQFVRFWAMQSTLLGLLWFAVGVVLSLAASILSHIPFLGTVIFWVLQIAYWPLSVALFVAWVICIIKAFSNQEWEIPWLGKIARQRLAKLDQEKVPAWLAGERGT